MSRAASAAPARALPARRIGSSAEVKHSSPITGTELLELCTTDVTAADLLEIERLLGRCFGRKAIQPAGRFWNERGLTDEETDASLHE